METGRDRQRDAGDHERRQAGSSSRSGRGVLVQANSGESVTGIVIAGAGGLYAGVAGAIAAEVFVDQTRASIGQGATINGSNGGANANQDVTVTARDSTVVSMTEGTVAVGLAGIGGAVDVAVITNATSAFVGDNTTINAARYVTVDALTNRQTSSTVASIAGGLAGVGAAISVLAVANGPDADQTSKTGRVWPSCRVRRAGDLPSTSLETSAEPSEI